MRRFGGWILAAAWLAMASGARAEEPEPGVRRTEVCRADVIGPDGRPTGMELICMLVEVAPGASLPRHSHHGLEATYSLSEGVVQAPGKPAQAAPAGSHALYTRDMPHSGVVIGGDKPLRVYTVYVVDKGRPLHEPAK